MTREQFLKVVDKIDTYSDYPWKHELNYLRDHDAEQRKTIERLRETLEFITMNDHSLTIKQAAQCAAQVLAETEEQHGHDQGRNRFRNSTGAEYFR